MKIDIIAKTLVPELYREWTPHRVDAIDENYVEKTEAAIGCTLPPDYAWFLRNYPRTGRVCNFLNDTLAMIKGIDSYLGAPDGMYPVNYIMAQSKYDTYDLLASYNISRYEYPHCLEIAETGTSSPIRMLLCKNKFGVIEYMEWDENPNYPVLANSFTDFIERLRFE